MSVLSLATVGIGANPNDGTGDTIRGAFQKVNSNFEEIGSTLTQATGINYLPTRTGAVSQTVWQAIQNAGVSLWDWGVVGNGVTDDTAAVQAAINWCVANGFRLCEEKGGSFLVGPLNGNGTGTATPANNQWNGLPGFKGAGRTRTTFIAKPGAYSAGQYVFQCNNVAECTFQGFGVITNAVGCNGIDLSWIGGSSGIPSLAPSNQNTLRDIYVSCGAGTTIGLNLDQFHDSPIEAILVGVPMGQIAVSAQGPGGYIGLKGVNIGSGLLRMSVQNGSVTDCVLTGGVLLTGSSYNNIHFQNCQIYDDTSQTPSVAINSTAFGNANRGLKFTNVYFNNATTSSVMIQGSFWTGARFEVCHFGNNTNLFGTITPLAGAGVLPIFTFAHSDFASTTPTSLASHYLVEHQVNRNSTGTRTAYQFPDSVLTQGPTFTHQNWFGSGGQGYFGDLLGNGNNRTLYQFMAATNGFSGVMQDWITNNTLNNNVEQRFWAWQTTQCANPHLWLRNGANDSATSGAPSIEIGYILKSGTDNTYSLGVAAKRWSQLFAGASTINTSDGTEKQQIQAPTSAELNVGRALRALFKSYKFNDAVEKKGADARIHFGLVAQDVQAAFQANGLDADAYSMFCSDSWYELNGEAVSPDGSGKYPEGATQVTRLGLRYDEVKILIMAADAADIAAQATAIASQAALITQLQADMAALQAASGS